MNLPNYLTLLRIILVPVFLSYVLYYSESHRTYRWWALGFFLIAILTDAVDGLIARRFKLRTQLGTFLDPFADKLLLLSGFIGIACSQSFLIHLPLWTIVVIVFRDLLIISGLVIIFLNTGQINVRPNKLGKLTTFFQMVTISLLLLESRLSLLLAWVTVALTILSGITYTVRGIKFLNAKRREAVL